MCRHKTVFRWQNTPSLLRQGQAQQRRGQRQRHTHRSCQRRSSSATTQYIGSIVKLQIYEKQQQHFGVPSAPWSKHIIVRTTTLLYVYRKWDIYESIYVCMYFDSTIQVLTQTLVTYNNFFDIIHFAIKSFKG